MPTASMVRVPIEEAKDRLAALVADAVRGEDVVIEGDGASVRLVVEAARPSARPSARFGSARGLVVLADDFDALLPDFDAYAP